MSQLIISRFFKPSLCKNFLRHTSIGHIRLLSSTTHTSNMLNSGSDHDETKTTWFYDWGVHPFLYIDHIVDKDKGMIKDKNFKYAVCDSMTSGFLRNGLEFNRCYWKDKSVHVSIAYDPSSPKLKDLNVCLPTLPPGSKIQCIAMSSLPIRDKDWVVGVKLSGSQVKFCRPFGSFQWVDAKTTPHAIDPFASLMFFKKDQKFYVPTRGGNYLCSLDPNSKEEKDQLDFVELGFDDLPNSALNELAEVSSCSKTDHLVESPTGQLFLVRWYGEDEEKEKDVGNDDDDDDFEKYEDLSVMTTLKHKVKKFMVFRAEEEPSWYKPYHCRKKMIYTEDIGDLCIFLGHGEAFCVPASSSPGLKPNCIYFVGYNFGVYDLNTKTCTVLHYEDGVSITRSYFPYWPPPSDFDTSISYPI